MNSKIARERADRIQKLEAALWDVVEAYTARFGRGHRYIGPIDAEIEAARRALATPKVLESK